MVIRASMTDTRFLSRTSRRIAPSISPLLTGVVKKRPSSEVGVQPHWSRNVKASCSVIGQGALAQTSTMETTRSAG